MLSSILFQDLGEKVGSIKSVTQHEGSIHMMPDDRHSLLEEETLVGGEVKKDAFTVVRYVYIACYSTIICWI